MGENTASGLGSAGSGVPADRPAGAGLSAGSGVPVGRPAATGLSPDSGTPAAPAPGPASAPAPDPEIEAILASEAPRGKHGLLRGRGAERAAVALLYVLLAAAFLGSFAMGKYALSLHDTLQVIAHLLFGTQGTYAPAAETVFLQVRLPRIVTCVFAGAALAVSGAVYQGIFKNPMVSPDLLGASSGSAFGACVGILLGLAYSQIQAVAFVLGLAAVGLTVAVSQAVTRGRGSGTVTMILTGMVVTALFNAGVGICKLLADADTQLGEITFWLMGSMTHVGFSDIPRLVLPIVAGTVPLVLLRYRLNVLSFGDEEARTLGLNVPLLRGVFIVCSTLVTSATVACCGMVGWIGLVIPHLLRLLLGPDYRLLVPASIAGGGLFLLLVDNITRIFFQVEVSIGILTALVGAPFFLVLLVKGRRGWE